MSLPKPWQDLDRATLSRVPDGYGVYELGNADGDSRSLEAGVLRDELKEALAYGDAERVRWMTASSREHARRLLDEHGTGETAPR